MKNRLFAVLLVALFGFLSMAAQDLIYKKDGSTVACQVEEITETTVKYRAADNLTGPLYNIPVTSIIKILYRNGKTDIFDASFQAAPVAEPSPVQAAPQSYYQQQGNMNDASLLVMDAYQNNSGLRNQAKNLRIIGWTVGPALLVAGGIILYLSDLDFDYYGTACGCGIGCAVLGIATCITCNVIAHNKYKKADRIDMMSISVDREVLKMGDKSLCLGVNYSKDNLAHVSSFGPSLSIRF